VKPKLKKILEKLAKKKLLYPLLGFLVFTISASGSYIFFSLNKIFVKDTKEEVSAQAEGAPEIPTDDPTTNVLIMGMGGPGHPGGALSDANILLHIDAENKKAAMITIPRDLWVPIPSGDRAIFNKFNKAHALGGGELAKKVASLVTGLSVDKFIAVDFVGFQRIFGLLGEVTVDVPYHYEDSFYPVKGRELDLCGMNPQKINEIHQKYSGFELEKQFECRYEHIEFEKGEMDMEGKVALKFARSRHGDGDFGRARRQLAVLKGLKDELISIDIVAKAPKILEALVDNVTTDITLEEIKDFNDLVQDPEEYEIVSIQLTEDNVLTSSNGSAGFILIPKAGNNSWSEIKEFVREDLN
jgi:LCP family protein required for cell wall assembly